MPVPLLEGHYEDIPEDDSASRIRQLERRVDELESRFAGFRPDDLKRDAVVALLNVLGKSMRQVASGQMDISEQPSGHSGVENLDRWNSIKARLGGKEAELIDVLLTAGPRTNTQLKGLLKLAYSTVAALTLKMSNLGFLTRSGEAWALKQ